MAIDLIESSGGFYETQSVSSANWRLSPPMLFFYWMAQSNVPAPFLHKIEFPRYNEILQFAEHSVWRFETVVENQSTVPFLQVQNPISSQNSLGIPFEDNGSFYRKEVGFNFVALALLSEGVYTANVKYKVTAINPLTSSREIIAEKSMYVEFWVNYYSFALDPPCTIVYQNSLFTFTSLGAPEPIVVNYNLNGPLPEKVSLYYFALPNTMVMWNFVSSDAKLQGTHVPVHPYFSKFDIFFNSGIESLTEGTYNFNVQISSFGVGLMVPVVLNVFAEIDFTFSVNPNPITFQMGSEFPSNQVVNVISQNSWNIVGTLPSWLNISQFSGGGNSTLLISIGNISGMQSGTYNFDLTFVSGGVEYIVPVSFVLLLFAESSFNASDLYFTNDGNLLKFNSQVQNSYVKINASVKIFKPNSYEEIVYIRNYDIPLYAGKGDFHPGSVVHKLFEEINALEDVFPDFENSYSRSQYKPAEISLLFEEKSYSDIVIIPGTLGSGTIPTFKMIKGFRPYITQNNMALLTVAQQDILRVTPNSAFAVSFVHFGSPQVVVKKNNQVIEDTIITSFPGTGQSQKVLYTSFKKIEDLKVGDIVEIMIMNNLESRTQRYLVFNPGVASTYIVFLNDFDLPEFFEFSGERKINSAYTHTMSSKFRDRFSFSQKEDTVNLQSVTVNSGQLQPRDHIMIDAIIKSKRVWCSIDNSSGPFFRVDATSSKMNNDDTNHGEIDYNVEFNILESNAVLYPGK